MCPDWCCSGVNLVAVAAVETSFDHDCDSAAAGAADDDELDDAVVSAVADSNYGDPLDDGDTDCWAHDAAADDVAAVETGDTSDGGIVHLRYFGPKMRPVRPRVSDDDAARHWRPNIATPTSTRGTVGSEMIVGADAEMTGNDFVVVVVAGVAGVAGVAIIIVVETDLMLR